MRRICIALFCLALCAGAAAKTVVVFGDSYSTFEGCIPEGYSCWYGRDWPDCTDVHDADSTWWGIFCRETDYQLLINSSYSGSCVCTTGYEGEYQKQAFALRVKQDIVGVPDLVLIFGGTNDCWSGSPRGEVIAPWQWNKADLSQTIPAMCHILGYLKENYPGTRVVVMNNSDICADIVDGYARAAKLYGAECIQLVGIDKEAGHPSKLGMRQIAGQLNQYLFQK